MVIIANYNDIIKKFTEEQESLRKAIYKNLTYGKNVVYVEFKRQHGLSFALHHIAHSLCNTYHVIYALPTIGQIVYMEKRYNMPFQYVVPNKTTFNGIGRDNIIIFDNVKKDLIYDVLPEDVVEKNYVVIGENKD